MAKVGPSDANVLICGEHGTGKDVAARWLHNVSDRSGESFVAVNAGGFGEGVFESEVLGHVRGAFTDARNDRAGCFELADRGTLFLDEIANVPYRQQAVLLRVLETGEIRRVGSAKTQRVDVRVLSATNADIGAAVANSEFREDLYYRLNVITIQLPPLSRRVEDIPLISQHFLRTYSSENEKQPRRLTSEAMDLLMAHHWPGNVRELENVIERAVVLSTGEEIGVDLLPGNIRNPDTTLPPPDTLPVKGVSFKEAVSAYERQLIVKALQACGGVQKRAAERLKVKPTTLHEMMKRLQVRVESRAS